MAKVKYALAGCGPAAFFAAEAIRERDSAGEIVMIGVEDYLPYYRPLTSYYIDGSVPKERLFIKNEDHYRKKNIQFIKGRVTAVRGQEGVLVYEQNGTGTEKNQAEEKLHFQKLLIATGSAPVKPDIPGISCSGVYPLRTIEDAENISRAAQNKKKAVLLGGGLVSLKAACALKKLGLDITVVISSSHVLSQMLDREGGSVVAGHLEINGIKMIFENDAAQINSSTSGITGVTLADGQVLEADLVVFGKGVEPNISFLEDSDIKHSCGVPVNERLQTNHPHVFAAGDTAISQDLVLGRPAINALWPNAVVQGATAGANMAGDEMNYDGSLGMNATEFFGLPVIAAGLARSGQGSRKNLEIYRFNYPLPSSGERRYMKLVFQNNRLAGYIMIGKNGKAGMLTNLIASRQLLEPRRMERLTNWDFTYM